jgi:hypothetical protein
MSALALLFSHDPSDHPFVSSFAYPGGLAPLYRAVECELVEVAVRGTIANLPVTLIVDEEGLYKQPSYRNRGANDVASEISGNPVYALQMPLVGHAALVYDTGEDWRGFTPDEFAKIVVKLRHDGYDVIVSDPAV